MMLMQVSRCFDPLFTSIASSPTLAAQRPLAEDPGNVQKPIGPAPLLG